MKKKERKKPEQDKEKSINPFLKLKADVFEFFTSTWKLLSTQVWDVEASALPYIKRKLVRTTRIFAMVGRGFKEDECGLHASSLTYMTLLSFVPVLALAVSVAKSVSDTEVFRNNAKDFVRSLVIDVRLPGEDIFSNTDNTGIADENGLIIAAENEDVESMEAVVETLRLDTDDSAIPTEENEGSLSIEEDNHAELTIERVERLIDTGFDRVEQLNFGALGGIGLIFLFWTVIVVLGNVEAAFNKVWGVTKGRTLARKFTDYLSVLIVFPVLAAASSSIPVLGVIEDHLSRFDNVMKISETAGWPVFQGLWILITMTIAFAFILIFTPNTKVKAKPGIIGGFVCAVGFAVWLKICVALQIGVVKYSTLFGSFAIVPIILSWVFVSWEILLFSAEVSYAFQNVDVYGKDMGWREANQKGRIMLAVAILREAVRSLDDGDGLIRLGDLGKRHGLSPRLIRNVVFDLQKCGIIVETANDSEVYAVRVDMEIYTIGDLLKALINMGVSPDPLGVMNMKTSSVIASELERTLEKGLATKIRNLPDNEKPVPLSADTDFTKK
jgi:membrane protein